MEGNSKSLVWEGVSGRGKRSVIEMLSHPEAHIELGPVD